MTNRAFGRASLSAVCTLAVLLAGCSEDLALPSSSGEGVDLSIVDGNGQTGVVGEELPEPLIVIAAAGGTPVMGHEVAFVVAGDSSAGRLEPDTAVTGPDGRAVAHWVLGSRPGPHQVQASLVVTEPAPPPSAVFQASAVAAEPDSVRADAPASQPGVIGQPVAEDPAVLVVDRFGNPVAGVTVQWDVTVGGGTVDNPQTASGGDGRASVTWTLGPAVGVQKLSATVAGVHGSPVRFTATVLF